jgi:flagellar biosynthesis protein
MDPRDKREDDGVCGMSADMPSDPTIDITDTPTAPANKHAVGRQKAVAISHERGDVPKVVASGAGSVAEQILQIAYDRGIKVREDAELVEILSLIDIDSPVPLEAFAAVAEILAYVYQANAGAKQRAVKE